MHGEGSGVGQRLCVVGALLAAREIETPAVEFCVTCAADVRSYVGLQVRSRAGHGLPASVKVISRADSLPSPRRTARKVYCEGLTLALAKGMSQLSRLSFSEGAFARLLYSILSLTSLISLATIVFDVSLRG